MSILIDGTTYPLIWAYGKVLVIYSTCNDLYSIQCIYPNQIDPHYCDWNPNSCLKSWVKIYFNLYFMGQIRYVGTILPQHYDELFIEKKKKKKYFGGYALRK